MLAKLQCFGDKMLLQLLQQHSKGGGLPSQFLELDKAVALQSTHLASLSRNDIYSITRQYKTMVLFREMSVITDSNLLTDLGEKTVREIYEKCKTQKFQKSQFVFREKDEADALYFIKQGQFGVSLSAVHIAPPPRTHTAASAPLALLATYCQPDQMFS